MQILVSEIIAEYLNNIEQYKNILKACVWGTGTKIYRLKAIFQIVDVTKRYHHFLFRKFIDHHV